MLIFSLDLGANGNTRLQNAGPRLELQKVAQKERPLCAFP